MELLRKYKNGNYTVCLYSDGTKEMATDEEEFISNFPDSIDLKITDYCDQNCPMCHENSLSNGKHANLDAPFLGKLHAGTELAIGGGNPLSHPQLVDFLQKLKVMGIVANITINEKHLLTNMDFVQSLVSQKLVYGVGISLNEYSKKTFEFAKTNSNIVLHVVCGVADLDKLLTNCDEKLKILLLGYKKFGRGENFFSKEVLLNISNFRRALPLLSKKFGVVSFDNLALQQLNVEKIVSDSIWNSHYMGDDGKHTMYIDLVNKKFAKNSISEERYDLLPTVDEMLTFLKNKE